MAVGCHIVRLTMKPISQVGTPVDKDTATIKEMMTTSSELRVMPNSAVPNSANYPTIDAYIQLEAANSFKVAIINQTMIITYNG